MEGMEGIEGMERFGGRTCRVTIGRFRVSGCPAIFRPVAFDPVAFCPVVGFCLADIWSVTFGLVDFDAVAALAR
jgi:hypothetical protein